MASFRQLADRLAELSTVPSRCARLASESIGKLIDDQFQRGEDPYGTPWEPLAEATIAKGRRDPPLTDTERLRDEVTVKPTQGSGIEILMLTPYAHFHQTGTKHMPERSLLPDGGELPEEWEDAIEDAFKRSLKGRR